MHLIKRGPLAFVLAGLAIGSIVTSAPVRADEATPTALAALPAVECTTPPLDQAAMGAAITTGAPLVLGYLQGTPVPSNIDNLALTPGTAADAATTDKATAAIQQFVACLNDGDGARLSAVLTEQGRENYLGFSFLGFLQIVEGNQFNPATATVEPDMLNRYLGAMAVTSPLAQANQTTIYKIEQIETHDGGVVTAVVTMAVGDKTPAPAAVVMRQENGEIRVSFGPETVDTGAATPTP